MKKSCHSFVSFYKCATFASANGQNMGKSYTASSLRILQGLTAAKATGCSGAM